MFLRQTTFSLLSLVVDDDNGFPQISIRFNISDTSEITLTDPQKIILFSDTYYNGIHNESLYLSGYRTTIVPGTYKLKAIDSLKNTIFENELHFTGANLSLVSLTTDRWNEETNSYFLALHLTFKNSGDLPAYPDKIIVHQGISSIESLLLPIVVRPAHSEQTTCCIFLPDIPAEGNQLTISVLDSSGAVLLQSSPITTKINPINSWEYSWYYFGQHTLRIPGVDWFFDYYKSLNRFDTIDYSAYVFDPYDNQYIDFLVHQILSLNNVRTDVEKINFVASFVQSIEYRNDDSQNSSYEYPRYPLETLKERRGDCEDKAILAASLFQSLGYNISLLRLPQHMAIGVDLNETISGYSYYINHYYFLETTTLHMTLGRVPPEYQNLTNVNVTIYPITQRPLLIHHWKNATRYQISNGIDYVRVQMILENLGTATTSEIEFRGGFYDKQDQIYNLKITKVLSIAAIQKRQMEISLDVPTSLNLSSTTLKTQLYLDGIMVDQRESVSRFP